MVLMLTNFLLGFAGALLTVYLFKNTPIPEFPPVDDVKEASEDALKTRAQLEKRQAEVDAIQDELRTDPSNAPNLTRIIRAIEPLIAGDRARLGQLERRIRTSQMFSRALGFAAFIILGGVVAALLAGRVKVSAAGGDATLPEGAQALLIGATWTTFLSALGFRSTQNAATDAIDDAKTRVGQQVDALKNDVVDKLKSPQPGGQGLASAQNRADLADSLSEEFDRVRNALNERLELSKRNVREAGRRVF